MVTFLLGRIGFDCTREMFESDGKAQEFKERKLYDIEERRRQQDDFAVHHQMASCRHLPWLCSQKVSVRYTSMPLRSKASLRRAAETKEKERSYKV